MTRPPESTPLPRAICPRASRPTLRRGASPRKGWRPYELRDRDPRVGAPDLRSRGGPLLRLARGRTAPAQVLHRLSAAARPDDAEGNRVRHRDGPTGRVRVDTRHAPTDPTRRRAAVLPGRRGGPGAPGPAAL